MGRRHTVRNARVPDLALGAHQPLGHRTDRHQERSSNLARGQPAQRAQRQSDLGFWRQRGMAAGEDQLEPFVWNCFHHRLLLKLVHQTCLPSQHLLLFRQRLITPNTINGLAPRRRRNPGPRVIRNPILPPTLQRHHQRILKRILRQLKIAQIANQTGQHPPRLPAECLGDYLVYVTHEWGRIGDRRLEIRDLPQMPRRGMPRRGMPRRGGRR